MFCRCRLRIACFCSKRRRVFVQAYPEPFPREQHGNFQIKVIEHDRLRLRQLMKINAPTGRAVSTLAEYVGTGYTVSVGVGTPPNSYQLLVDTASGNTWLSRFIKTSSSVQTNEEVSVTYTRGSFEGTEYTDTVTLVAPSLYVTNQSIGVASESQGFSGLDGVLGLGPADLTVGTLTPGAGAIPTVMDNLARQGRIATEVLGISFEPETATGEVNGELTFGGIDSSKTSSVITYASVTSTSPASQYWGFNAEIMYNGETLLPLTAGVIDSSTATLALAENAFNAYKSVTGATLDPATGFLTITAPQLSNLKTMTFVISGTTFQFTANAQLWPRTLNSVIGGASGKIYLAVSSTGTNSGTGLDFVFGQAVLERFYSVYDRPGNQIGFATTPFTTATTN